MDDTCMDSAICRIFSNETHSISETKKRTTKGEHHTQHRMTPNSFYHRSNEKGQRLQSFQQNGSFAWTFLSLLLLVTYIFVSLRFMCTLSTLEHRHGLFLFPFPHNEPEETDGDGMLSRRLRNGIPALTINSSATIITTPFPIHITSNDLEEIEHPGITFSGHERIKILAPDLDFPSTLAVPKFWEPSEYGRDGVRASLLGDGRRLPSRDAALAIGSRLLLKNHKRNGMETIFVSIASYRDVECQSTVESIYQRAQHPERIRVAVVDQIDVSEGDSKCTQPKIPCSENPNQVLCQFRHLINVFELPAYKSIGPVFARHVAHRMYRGEYYALQVDAHVRFVQDWDTQIIAQWESTEMKWPF
jgi:hypothetical protein